MQRTSASTLSSPQRAFTLIELLVTLAIISLLLSLAVPRYFGSVDKAKETLLKENLHQVRDALDKFYGDNNHYPATLEDLVNKKYLRKLPVDPVTDSATTWIVVPPSDPQKGGVYEIKSGASGNGKDGTPYSSW